MEQIFHTSVNSKEPENPLFFNDVQINVTDCPPPSKDEIERQIMSLKSIKLLEKMKY